MGKGDEAPVLRGRVRECKEMSLSGHGSRASESSSYISGKVLTGFWTTVI